MHKEYISKKREFRLSLKRRIEITPLLYITSYPTKPTHYLNMYPKVTLRTKFLGRDIVLQSNQDTPISCYQGTPQLLLLHKNIAQMHQCSYSFFTLHKCTSAVIHSSHCTNAPVQLFILHIA